jgi:hypothetical protein
MYTHESLIVCCLFTCCGINAFRMANNNLKLTAKSYACMYIEYLVGIFSWSVDYLLPSQFKWATINRMFENLVF